MEVGPGAIALVVELGAQSAIVEGKRVELPPIEFSLLAALAARPGVLIPHKELSDVAFGAGVPMTVQDLHWRISRMRKLVGERGREAKWIENRRGQGYLLDLPEFAVQVVDRATSVFGVPAPSHEAPEETLAKVNQPGVLEPEDPLAAEPKRSPEPQDLVISPGMASPPTERLSLRPRVVLVATLIGCAVLTSTWAAGYLLSSGRGGETPVLSQPIPSELPSSPDIAKEPVDKEKPTERKNPDRKRSKDRRVKPPLVEDEAPAPIVLADSSESVESAPSTRPAPADAEPKPKDSDKEPGRQQGATAPALPPAPTRLLYHLVDRKTGDHFITTDGAAASEYEAMGYEGGAIAQVYDEQEDNTRAITTNDGAAYVFTSATPKTEPSSRTVALWYATDGQGDFFYTTSRSEAESDGWSASLVGYARSL